MWTCPKCQEASEDTFDACWKCGTTKSGVAVQPSEPGRRLDCLRCRTPMDFLGTKTFQEGTNWGVLGSLGVLFVKQDRFETYRCKKCGKVEFFVGGEDRLLTPDS